VKREVPTLLPPNVKKTSCPPHGRERFPSGQRGPAPRSNKKPSNSTHKSRGPWSIEKRNTAEKRKMKPGGETCVERRSEETKGTPIHGWQEHTRFCLGGKGKLNIRIRERRGDKVAQHHTGKGRMNKKKKNKGMFPPRREKKGGNSSLQKASARAPEEEKKGSFRAERKKGRKRGGGL